MIRIIPSISIYQGKCVKVPPGDFEHPVVYGDSPVEVAQIFEEHGIRRIHLVDLDGAKKGSVVNYGMVRMIAGYTNLTVDFAGGIQTEEDVRLAFANGAVSVAAASVAASNRELFLSWLNTYGRERIVLTADTRKGKIVTDGWRRSTDIDLFELIGYYYERGIKYVKCTDVGRDGTLEGPAIELYKQILVDFPDICLMASGGVRSVNDIDSLADAGVYGVIFGKAYYEGKIKLDDLRNYLD
jgi:phosphoribosylformimino-5-aminoimidazole carboxamide ribotide isomerase